MEFEFQEKIIRMEGGITFVVDAEITRGGGDIEQSRFIEMELGSFRYFFLLRLSARIGNNVAIQMKQMVVFSAKCGGICAPSELSFYMVGWPK